MYLYSRFTYSHDPQAHNILFLSTKAILFLLMFACSFAELAKYLINQRIDFNEIFRK